MELDERLQTKDANARRCGMSDEVDVVDHHAGNRGRRDDEAARRGQGRVSESRDESRSASSGPRYHAKIVGNDSDIDVNHQER